MMRLRQRSPDLACMHQRGRATVGTGLLTGAVPVYVLQCVGQYQSCESEAICYITLAACGAECLYSLETGVNAFETLTIMSRYIGWTELGSGYTV